MQSPWMLLASFIFAIMGVCVKLASASCSTSEIVMVRGLIGMTLLTTLMHFKGQTLRIALPWHHAWWGQPRCGFGFFRSAACRWPQR